jgi:hypothetical protein
VSENFTLKAGESERNNGVLIWIPGADALWSDIKPVFSPESGSSRKVLLGRFQRGCRSSTSSCHSASRFSAAK